MVRIFSISKERIMAMHVHGMDVRGSPAFGLIFVLVAFHVFCILPSKYALTFYLLLCLSFAPSSFSLFQHSLTYVWLSVHIPDVSVHLSQSFACSQYLMFLSIQLKILPNFLFFVVFSSTSSFFALFLYRLISCILVSCSYISHQCVFMLLLLFTSVCILCV